MSECTFYFPVVIQLAGRCRSVQRKYKVCGLTEVTRSRFLEGDVAVKFFEMFFFLCLQHKLDG